MTDEDFANKNMRDIVMAHTDISTNKDSNSNNNNNNADTDVGVSRSDVDDVGDDVVDYEPPLIQQLFTFMSTNPCCFCCC